MCLGTCLLEYISLGSRQEYDEYRSSSREKNWELCKELFPHLCPLEFLALWGKEAFVWGMSRSGILDFFRR